MALKSGLRKKRRKIRKAEHMCKLCEEYGAGKKWYLNEDNYSPFAWEEAKGKEWFNSWFRGRDKSVADSAKALENALLKQEKLEQYRTLTERMISEDGNKGYPRGSIGQIITKEEAKAVVNIAPQIAAITCVCRLSVRGIKMPACLAFGKIGEMANYYPTFSPNGVEYITPKEAEDLIDKFSKQGMVHDVWFYPKPFVGLLCNAGYPDCQSIKYRFQ